MFYFCAVSSDLHVGNFPFERHFARAWKLMRCLFHFTWRKWHLPTASVTLLVRFGQLMAPNNFQSSHRVCRVIATRGGDEAQFRQSRSLSLLHCVKRKMAERWVDVVLGLRVGTQSAVRCLIYLLYSSGNEHPSQICKTPPKRWRSKPAKPE